MIQLGKILHDEFGPKGYTVNLNEPSYCAMKFYSIFNKDAAFVLPKYGKEIYFETSISKD